LTGIRRVVDTARRMLNNDDLAELLESTRDRISHMGSDTPSAQGIVHVLEGLIAMLREQAPSSSSFQFESNDQPGSESPEEPQQAPQRAPRRNVPARFRTQQREAESGAANPLLGPQYADFFKKLIADNKPEMREAQDGESEEPQEDAQAEPPSAPQSASKPKYSGFFDALVQKQKTPEAEPPPKDEPEPQEETRPEEPPPRRTNSGFHDQTATG
jgi:hypothetical protein